MRYADLIRRAVDEARPAAGTNVLMITGKLAEQGLRRVMAAIAPDDFTYEIRALDIQVAAWLTTDQVIQDAGDVSGFDLMIIPGKVQGNEEDIQRELSIEVVRGPDCYSELPEFLEAVGLELSADVVTRPRIAVIGSGAAGVAYFLRKTYEVPEITLDDLVRDGEEQGIDADRMMLHNVMAELVRSRLTEITPGRGYMLTGYPRIARDLEWLDSMRAKPDAIITCGDVDPDLLSALGKRSGHIVINTEAPLRDQQVQAYAAVEQLMAACVVKDPGES
jgi:adenylate kinase family enzyme